MQPNNQTTTRFADLGGDYTFYTDVMDVYVHEEPVGEALRYGTGTGELTLNRLDHCQYVLGRAAQLVSNARPLP